MAEYARIHAGTVAELVDLDPAVHAAWVAAGNPKAQVYIPVVDAPTPSFDPATQAIVEHLAVALSGESVTRSWSVRAKSPEEFRKSWTSYEFLKRFTWQERSDIRIAGFDDDAVADFLTLCTAANEVISDDPMTQAGMDYLVSLNLLTPARRAEILS